MLEAAARAAHQRGDPISLARAICSMAPLPGASTTTGLPDRAFRSLAEAALDTLPPSEGAWRTRVLALLGSQLAATDDPERGNEMVCEAVHAARRLDDPVAIGRALLSYRFRGGPLELAERMTCGYELVELGDRIGVEVFSYVGRQQLWWCYRELGDREQMDRWYAEAADRMRLPDVEQLSRRRLSGVSVLIEASSGDVLGTASGEGSVARSHQYTCSASRSTLPDALGERAVERGGQRRSGHCSDTIEDQGAGPPGVVASAGAHRPTWSTRRSPSLDTGARLIGPFFGLTNGIVRAALGLTDAERMTPPNASRALRPSPDRRARLSTHRRRARPDREVERALAILRELGRLAHSAAARPCRAMIESSSQPSRPIGSATPPAERPGAAQGRAGFSMS